MQALADKPVHKYVLDIHWIALVIVVVMSASCAVPSKLDPSEGAEELAKARAYREALKDQRKGVINHVCLYPTWFGENKHIFCPDCYLQLDSTFIALGITPRHQPVALDHSDHNAELLFWREYQGIMDSLILVEHGPRFLDSLCATATVAGEK
jgi:hypothetical protein